MTIFFADKEHWVTAYLEPGETVKITGDANSPLLLQVKGGRTNDKLTAFKKKIAPLLTELTNLSNSLNSKDLNADYGSRKNGKKKRNHARLPEKYAPNTRTDLS